MLLTPEQRAAAEAGRDVDQVVSRGSARRGLWRGGVFVYTIHGSLSKYFVTNVSPSRQYTTRSVYDSAASAAQGGRWSEAPYL